MTEKYQPNIDTERMWQILREEDTGYVGLVDGDRPYVVPVSYAVVDRQLVIHGALKGRKLDLIRANPRFCFTVSRHPEKTRPHRPEEGCTYRFESVLCEGTARVVEEPAERLPLLQAFKAWFDEKTGGDPAQNPVTEKAAHHCSCLVLEIATMTGRAKIQRVQD
jgi:nitroimidazol reductase NimA-like FMN-containing flavoprotein (pyridoxamine 5'-phosphate oxidase superfamily)